MRKKMYTVKLTAEEAAVINDALAAALAGPYSEGDFCWNETAANAASSAQEKLPTVPETVYDSLHVDEGDDQE